MVEKAAKEKQALQNFSNVNTFLGKLNFIETIGKIIN